MKIIFSPSKGMKCKNLKFATNETIPFSNKTEFLISELQKFDIDTIEKFFKIKGTLLEETFNNIKNYNELNEYESINLYDGVTFRQLEFEIYSKKDVEYLSKNLLIFSALYGVIFPNTLIKPYRLDMSINFLEENLYKYWKKDINDYLNIFSNEIFINLASNEFSKILDYKKFSVVDIEFRQLIDGKLKNISTEGKKARGMLLNYMIKNKVCDVEMIKNFCQDGYSYSSEKSNETKLFFIQNKNSDK